MFANLVRSAGIAALLGGIASPLVAQIIVAGTVRDERNAPIVNASVVVRGTRGGVMTNEIGNYRLVIDDSLASRDSLSMIVRAIGFEPATRLVDPHHNRRADFTLKGTPVRLEGVVVTGTGTGETRPAGRLGRMSKDGSALALTDSRRGDARDEVAAAAPASPAVADRLSTTRAREKTASGRGGTRGGRQDPSAGILTAAVWEDSQHWPQYARFLRRAEQNSWNPWGLNVGQTNLRQIRRDIRPRAPRRAVDIGFLVDATGSMGDEMSFLQSELKDIVRRVRAVEPELDVRVSIVFYRDRGDEFITKSLPFTRNVDDVVSYISETSAGGGGDFPEDMNAGFEAMMGQRWSRDAVPQMLFLLADAPPQMYPGTDYTYHEAIQDAAANGIAIYPVAASGVDKPTEFLFRAMAVMTGGKYVFLTDDSGVGNSHEEPDISGYTVEKLNDLMVREIRSYVAAHVGGRRVAGNR